MGKAAASFADQIIITNDNPRTEDPKQIVEDIISGIDDEANVVLPAVPIEASKAYWVAV